MKNHVRMSVGFARYPNARLNSFGILALFCLKDNPLFPDLPVSFSDLTALVTAFQDGMTAAAQGGMKDRAALREARADLIQALRRIVNYVQSLGLTKESDALSSGFDVVGWDNSQKALETPTLKGLDNSEPNQLRLKLAAVRHAKAYQVQYRLGDGDWMELGYYPHTRDIVLANTVAGTVYAMRMRAIGGSTMLSPWSAAISVMSM
jgi:hypothetical protein